MLVDTGVILDPKMIYWDVRPSANFPTVEVRVADVPATVAETVLLATLIRAAVMTALEERDRGEEARRLPPAALRGGVLEGRPRRIIRPHSRFDSTAAARCRRVSS